MSKFNVGQRVYLFNSLGLRVESDDVYAILFAPMYAEGAEQRSEKGIAERLESGEMYVQEQYQLAGHQGVVDAEVLFASEEECREFYRKFLAGE